MKTYNITKIAVAYPRKHASSSTRIPTITNASHIPTEQQQNYPRVPQRDAMNEHIVGLRTAGLRATPCFGPAFTMRGARAAQRAARLAGLPGDVGVASPVLDSLGEDGSEPWR